MIMTIVFKHFYYLEIKLLRVIIFKLIFEHIYLSKYILELHISHYPTKDKPINRKCMSKSRCKNDFI